MQFPGPNSLPLIFHQDPQSRPLKPSDMDIEGSRTPDLAITNQSLFRSTSKSSFPHKKLQAPKQLILALRKNRNCASDFFYVINSKY